MKETSPSSDSYIHRIRSWAASKANGSNPLSPDTSRPPTRPLNNQDTPEEKTSPAPHHATNALHPSSPSAIGGDVLQAANPTANKVADQTSSDHPPPAPPPQAEGEGPVVDQEKPERKNVAMRFYLTARSIILSSYINILLVLVPVGIASKAAGLKPGIVFAMNAIAIIPLAGLLSHATESVAKRMGDTVGALMNVTFGNAVELIIFIALQKNEIGIVQASLLGSILANLLLILGMCFLLGGLRYREQIYNSTVTQMSACLLSLSVMSLLLPTAFHASFSSTQETNATDSVLKVSRGTSVVLLIVYGMYLLFQLKSHAYMYESTPQHIIDEESAPGPVAHWMESSDDDSRTTSGSDSGSSSASNTTAKRLRRVIGRRRRRKSSSGSKDTADFATTRTPSITACSISPAHTDGPMEDTHAAAQLHPSAVDFAEDGDDEDRERGHVRSRKNSFIGILSKKERKKNRKRREKMEGKRSKCTEASATNEPSDPSSSAGKQPEENPDAPRRVDFAITEDAGIVTDSSQKRTFTLRGISSTIRPSVFMHPPPEPLPVPTGRPLPRVKYGIRRTNSLPDRLNQTSFAPARVPTSTNLQPLRIASTAIAEQKPADSEDEENISRTTAVFLLLISTGLVAVCAEFMVDSINAVVSGNSGLSETFIGLIILPIVGNAAEHVTAVTVASKNKMDLAIGVAVGSSIQIALFVTPFIVLLGWCMSKEMSLYFTLFETVSLFVSAFIVNFLVLDGRSNYLEGSLLCAAYVIIAVAAFFYPQVSDESVLGGNPDATSRIMMVRGLVDSVMGM